MLQYIPLSDFEHLAVFGDTTPRGLEEITCQRVEYQINSSAVRYSHDAVEETVAPRVKNVSTGNLMLFHEKLDLLFCPGGDINLGKN